MPKSLQANACLSAYRWYLGFYLEGSHPEAWNFAVNHWQDFLGQHPDHSSDDGDDASFFDLDYEGPSQVLAEK